MKKTIGGAIAIVLGLICFSAFPQSLLELLEATIPLVLIAGGCLTIYLKREEESVDIAKTATIEKESIEVESFKKEIEDKPNDDTPNFVGNTGSLVFHSPDCKFAKSKLCTIVFNNKEQAVQEGYKPCKICNP
ncbi:MAG: hypothetical protein KAQ72_12830 [Desulfobacula sp.]|nr:hypothetical protein [Desulfobacula sp.]